MQGLHISTAPTVTWFNTLVCSRLLLLQRGPDLAQAVAALKVLLREEKEHHAGGGNITLQVSDVLCSGGSCHTRQRCGQGTVFIKGSKLLAAITKVIHIL